MSEMYHKACYVYRSPGYMLQTSSTNTDIKNHGNKSSEMLMKKFQLLKRDIESRIDNEAAKTQEARNKIRTKFEKVNSKIDLVLNLQNTVTNFRNELQNVAVVLTQLSDRVQNIEKYLDRCSINAELARKNLITTQPRDIDQIKKTN